MTKNEAPLMGQAPGASSTGNGSGRLTVYAADDTQFSSAIQQAPCQRCGVIDHHHVEVGSGPHAAKLVCAHCASFIRWLPKNPPEVREANRQAGIRSWMSQQPPTQKQLKFLKTLAHKGSRPTNRLDASEKIDTLLKARGRYE